MELKLSSTQVEVGVELGNIKRFKKIEQAGAELGQAQPKQGLR